MNLNFTRELSGHPPGLLTLFFTELWERFSFYGMRAILVLFLISETSGDNPGMGWSNQEALYLYGWYTALVYIACVPGGLLGDKYLNNINAVTLGGALLCIGHLLLALKSEFFFFSGLIFIILGVGLLKPNISTLVGGLYKKNDVRRDQGFTIFYIGINFGAFFASLIVGYIGEVHGWHYGFSLAGFGMIIGQLFFITGKKKLKTRRVEKTYFKNLKFTPKEIDRLKLILIASIILVIFWASFEQAGGLMNIYAYEKTDRFLDFLNFEIPAGWFQSINPLLIIFLGFYVSSFWLLMRKKKIFSSSIFKIAIGLIIMGMGFIFMYFASVESHQFGKSSMHWLILAYLFHTIGELCASPVILSYITKLSPKKIIASIMGLYFAAIGIGNKLAGTIGQYSDKLGEKTVFLGITFICSFIGVLIIFLQKKMNKLSHGYDS